MEIEFRDKQRLELIETDRAFAEIKLPVSVIKSCQKKLNALRQAPSEMTLRNFKSFHYEKLQGKREGQRSIRLNDQWRLIFELDTNTKPPKATILEVDDYH